MKISVIHPSRNRPVEAWVTATNWAKKCDSGFEYILSLDISDKDLTKYYALFTDFNKSWNINGKSLTNGNKSAIEAINNAAKIATGDLLVVISDDFDCPEHWDTLLLQACKNYRSSRFSKDFCMKTDDGLQPTLITMPIMDRIYYERYGYVYHPDYKHMFADQELTAVALMTGKYIKSDLNFPHLHYSTGKSPKDEINVKNDLTWKQGETLFNERLKTNFGITEPVMQYSDIKWR